MAKKVYVGIDNIARETKHIYVGVNGVARKVVKGYIGVNGVAQQFWGDEGGLKVNFKVRIRNSSDVTLQTNFDVSIRNYTP